MRTLEAEITEGIQQEIFKTDFDGSFVIPKKRKGRMGIYGQRGGFRSRSGKNADRGGHGTGSYRVEIWRGPPFAYRGWTKICGAKSDCGSGRMG